MESRNGWLVATFTEIVTGEMVTLMPVTGSVQVDEEVLLDAVEVLVTHVTAVLAGAEPQEARPNRAMSKAKKSRCFTAPLDSLFEIPGTFGCVSILIPKTTEYDGNPAGRAPWPAVVYRLNLIRNPIISGAPLNSDFIPVVGTGILP